MILSKPVRARMVPHDWKLKIFEREPKKALWATIAVCGA